MTDTATVASAPTPLAADFPAATRDAWVALVEKSLKGGDFEKRLVSRTFDGLRVEPLYTRADAIAGADAFMPGAAPFTRGPRASRDAPGWHINQLVLESDPATANAAILEDLEGGASALAVQMESAGAPGLPVTVEALGRALDGVLLDVCPVTLMAGERFADAGNTLLSVWTGAGIAPGHRLGHLGADPLGWLAMTGRLGQRTDEAIADAVRLVAATRDMPGVTVLSADGHPYHAAGATEAQELAAVLATLVAYLRAAEAQGIAPAAALPKIQLGLAADTDQFATVAKLRAARRLAWRVADASGAGAAAAHVRVFSVTAWRMMSKRDPWTNMLRTTMACAAAALGGADTITVLPYTFALGRTDRFARRVARNTQLVLAEESSLGRVVDPAGGSWYVEKLTDDLARKAWSLFQEIEAAGGMAAALGSGLVQDRIAASAAARTEAIAKGRMELTGVSAFPLLGDDGVTVEPWPADATTAGSAIETVTPLSIRRTAEPFEALRDAADAHAATAGKPPTIFLASLGTIADHTVRSTWMRNYLATGGIAALASDGYADAAAAAAAFASSGAAAACIASSDAIYADHAVATARALKAAGARLVLMAGRPGDREADLKAAGVDQFIYAGLDAVAVLSALQSKLTA